MTPRTATTATITTEDERALHWAPCPTCWGQRRIWSHAQAANGEGTILVAASCSDCLGVGEVLR